MRPSLASFYLFLIVRPAPSQASLAVGPVRCGGNLAFPNDAFSFKKGFYYHRFALVCFLLLVCTSLCDLRLDYC